MRPKLDEHTIAAIAAVLQREVATLDEMAEEYGVHPRTIKRALRAAGHTADIWQTWDYEAQGERLRRKAREAWPSKEEVAEALRKGATNAQIAEQWGYSPMTISKIRGEYGLKGSRWKVTDAELQALRPDEDGWGAGSPAAKLAARAGVSIPSLKRWRDEL